MTMPAHEFASAIQSILPVQVLLVEDDATARSAFQRVLERHGYSVISAGDGGEALQLLRDTHVPVDVLVTDVQMPVVPGDELVTVVRQAWPELPVLFISGESSFAKLPDSVGGRTRFLLKPFGPDELAESIATLLRPVKAEVV